MLVLNALLCSDAGAVVWACECACMVSDAGHVRVYLHGVPKSALEEAGAVAGCMGC